MLKVSKKEILIDRIREVKSSLSDREPQYSVIDLGDLLLSKIENFVQEAKVLGIAQKLIVNPVHEILFKLRKTVCKNTNNSEECIEKAISDAYLEAFNKIVSLREKGGAQSR